MQPDVSPAADGPGDLARRSSLLGGRYRVYEPIGAGGMSVVHRGHDTLLDRPVAIKIARVDDPEYRDSLREEARAFGRLNHPRIAQIHDFGETPDGRCYIVMELVTGESLAARIAAGPLSPRAAMRVGAEVAAALAAVHAVGLVHRDVKPDNVIVTPNGAKLVDFGISAPVGGADSDAHGRLLGTPNYIAPERITDAPVGPASDVYSLGVLLYTMLSGSGPFPGRSSTEVLDAHVLDDPQPLPAVTGLPGQVAELCTACLARNPRRRPTAIAAATILNHPMTDLGRAVLAADRRRRRGRVLVGIATALALAAAGWAAGLDRKAAGEVPQAAGSPSPWCRITFVVSHDTGSRFTATLTVVNLAARTTGWQIELAFPSGQRITSAVIAGGQHLAVTQAPAGTATLRAAPANTLAGGTPTRIVIAASYHDTNLMPGDFRLDGHPCQSGLAGAIDLPSPAPGPPTATTMPTTGPASTVTSTDTATTTVITTTTTQPTTTETPHPPATGRPTNPPTTPPGGPPPTPPGHTKNPKPTK